MNKELLHQRGKDTENSVSAFFVRNPHMTILAIIGCLIGGIYSLWIMPIESNPEVKIPMATVVIPYPGASPSDVEKLVTDEMEETLSNLDNLRRLTSDSKEGSSVILVEFEADADLTDSIRELRDEVDTVKRDLPDEAEEPIVTQIRAEDRAIITFTLVGNRPLAELKGYVDELENRLEAVKGVSRVDVSGLPEREMQVLVDRKKLDGFGLSITDIARIISQNHVDFPVGSIRTDEYYYQASLKAQFDDPKELSGIVIAANQGRSIFLRDVAEVREVFAETKTEVHLYQDPKDLPDGAEEGQERKAVAMGVFKKVGEDLVRMTDETKVVVEEFQKEVLPEGVNVLITDDESDRIRRDIRNLARSALQTIIIIGLMLFLAFGTREALAAAVTIPILYLISLIGLGLVGATFNFLTFFALILSLGIVVDTSIVIIEGIYENMNEYGMDARQAGLASLAAFRAPLISGSLTTIAAFVPLALMSGIMGQYVKHIPITVYITLLASLFTALMLLPSMAVWLLKSSNGKPRKEPLFAPLFQKIRTWYSSFIRHILESNRLRRRWLASMVILFVLSGVLSSVGIIKFQMFGEVDFNFFIISVKAPEGSSLERTQQITKKVEAIIQKEPELVRYVSIVGDGAPHKARINMEITETDERKIKSYILSKSLRSKLKQITEAEVHIEEAHAGPPTGADIEIRLLGEDIRSLEEFASIVQDNLEQVPGAEEVRNDLELSPGEYHIRLKRDRLEQFGVSAVQIGSFLRTSIFGDNSVKINRSGEETDIVVRLDFRDRECMQEDITRLLEARDEVTLCRSNPKDVSELLNLLMSTPRGQVALSEMIEIELTSAVTTIRHFDTDRVVSVKADIAEGFVLTDVLSVIREKIDAMEIPDDVIIELGGENEDASDSMKSLARASILAFLMILIILTYQFGAFRQVFIVFMTMPLAVMGVLYGLALLRLPMSFPGMIGMVALLGIVVNDAIVLIDKINHNRLEQESITEAVISGCKQRLQPVIMTTLTTALGVLPLIFTGETFRDLAIVLAIGITIATVFTLVIVPILYVALETGHPICKVCDWVRVLFRKKEDVSYKQELDERARRANLLQDEV